jgi:hypothetical protein
MGPKNVGFNNATWLVTIELRSSGMSFEYRAFVERIGGDLDTRVSWVLSPGTRLRVSRNLL